MQYLPTETDAARREVREAIIRTLIIAGLAANPDLSPDDVRKEIRRRFDRDFRAELGQVVGYEI